LVEGEEATEVWAPVEWEKLWKCRRHWMNGKKRRSYSGVGRDAAVEVGNEAIEVCEETLLCL